MITKTIETDKIEIVGEFKMVQLREATIIKEDGVELTRTFHRRVITPSCDTSTEDFDIIAICDAVHSNTVKENYTAMLQAQEAAKVVILKPEVIIDTPEEDAE